MCDVAAVGSLFWSFEKLLAMCVCICVVIVWNFSVVVYEPLTLLIEGVSRLQMPVSNTDTARTHVTTLNRVIFFKLSLSMCQWLCRVWCPSLCSCFIGVSSCILLVPEKLWWFSFLSFFLFVIEKLLANMCMCVVIVFGSFFAHHW